ncbi:MAG TPA: hypothetical protein PK850_11220 [Ignavibacteria bacterium]|nr:hypothetical protein [Bacteroidota bacterium]HRF66523.1 hypothetical protein [Ignavibacteria bacterium]
MAKKKKIGFINVFSFILLTITITNFLLKYFSTNGNTIIKIVFNELQFYIHSGLYLLIYSWSTFIFEKLFYFLTWLLSLFLPIAPTTPRIIIPVFVSNALLLSLIITRIFQNTDYIVPREERAKIEKSTSKKQFDKIFKTEGKFWGNLHEKLEEINRKYYKVIEFFHAKLLFKFSKESRYSKFIRSLLIGAGGIFLWGYVRLAGYIINLIGARKLKYPILEMRRKFFKHFILIMVLAVATSVMIVLLNNYIVKKIHPLLLLPFT